MAVIGCGYQNTANSATPDYPPHRSAVEWQPGDKCSFRILPVVTQTRLFGPPRGCRSHCLVRDSGAQPECLERRSGSCATSPLEYHLVALAVQGRQQIVEDAGFPVLDLSKSKVIRRVGSR